MVSDPNQKLAADVGAIKVRVEKVEVHTEKLVSDVGGIKLRLEVLEVHAQKADAKIDQVQHSLVRHDLRFDGLENRFDGLEKRFDGLENRFDGLQEQFANMNGDLSRALQSMQRDMIGAVDLALTRFRRDETERRLNRLEEAVFGARE